MGHSRGSNLILIMKPARPAVYPVTFFGSFFHRASKRCARAGLQVNPPSINYRREFLFERGDIKETESRHIIYIIFNASAVSTQREKKRAFILPYDKISLSSHFNVRNGEPSIIPLAKLLSHQCRP